VGAHPMHTTPIPSVSPIHPCTPGALEALPLHRDTSRPTAVDIAVYRFHMMQPTPCMRRRTVSVSADTHASPRETWQASRAVMVGLGNRKQTPRTGLRRLGAKATRAEKPAE